MYRRCAHGICGSMSTERGLLSSEVSRWLRAQPALTGAAPPLVRADLPGDPVALFLDWIGKAATAGVPEAHVATLATVDEDGMPRMRAH